jgi:hypothetical protein
MELCAMIAQRAQSSHTAAGPALFAIARAA